MHDCVCFGLLENRSNKPLLSYDIHSCLILFHSCNILCIMFLQFQQSSLFNLYKGAMFKKHNFLSTTTSNNTAEDGSEEIET